MENRCETQIAEDELWNKGRRTGKRDETHSRTFRTTFTAFDERARSIRYPEKDGKFNIRNLRFDKLEKIIFYSRRFNESSAN